MNNLTDGDMKNSCYSDDYYDDKTADVLDKRNNDQNLKNEKKIVHNSSADQMIFSKITNLY
ncbi:hypothetical protein DERP_001832 [Dermatophagoides pteronyssinus]|uniref:Uncharacterized protein n=1 Tax=Dermatophagoides pteronyssinus TaxID=6956 RepID=A0ABQ8JBL9_DERPT|nr:hypothetical protein DERP_001832 [Dermatophagoides pteronyssinus]